MNSLDEASNSALSQSIGATAQSLKHQTMSPASFYHVPVLMYCHTRGLIRRNGPAMSRFVEEQLGIPMVLHVMSL